MVFHGNQENPVQNQKSHPQFLKHRLSATKIPRSTISISGKASQTNNQREPQLNRSIKGLFHNPKCCSCPTAIKEAPNRSSNSSSSSFDCFIAVPKIVIGSFALEERKPQRRGQKALNPLSDGLRRTHYTRKHTSLFRWRCSNASLSLQIGIYLIKLLFPEYRKKGRLKTKKEKWCVLCRNRKKSMSEVVGLGVRAQPRQNGVNKWGSDRFWAMCSNSRWVCWCAVLNILLHRSDGDQNWVAANVNGGVVGGVGSSAYGVYCCGRKRWMIRICSIQRKRVSGGRLLIPVWVIGIMQSVMGEKSMEAEGGEVVCGGVEFPKRACCWERGKKMEYNCFGDI